MSEYKFVSAETPPEANNICKETDDDGDEIIWYESDSVIVQLEDGDYQVATYILNDPFYGNLWIQSRYGDRLDDVVAWAPLPEPYIKEPLE